MRVLFSAAPGEGHLRPLLPRARVARAAGHDALISGGAGLAGIIRDSGFRHAVVGPPSLSVVRAAIPGIADLSGRRRALQMLRLGFCGPVATGMADDLLGLFATWRPDVIVREDMDLGAWIAAERNGIPHVTIQVTAFRRRFWDAIREPIAEVRSARDLPAMATYDELLGRAFFTTRPATLRTPSGPYPAATRELRPVADDRRPGDPIGDPFRHEDSRPRIAITLGTLNHEHVSLMRALIDGAAATGASVIVAAGTDPAIVGSVPDGVDVRGYIPISLLVEHADIIAFHGGSGTMLAAAAAGTPMLMTPIAADHLDNAEVCAAAGIARAIDLEAVSADAVATAIDAIIGDASMRVRSAAVAAEIAAMPGPEAALRVIEDVAG